MKQKTGRKLLGVLLALAMLVGLMPGMSLTAYAAEVSESFTTTNGGKDYTGEHFKISGTWGDKDGLAVGAMIESTHSVTVSSLNGETINKMEATVGYMENNGSLAVNQGSLSGFTYVDKGECNISVTNVNATSVTFTQPSTAYGAFVQLKTFKIYYDGVDVSSVTLNPATATLTVGAVQKLTATVEPDNATDKTVKWSVDGTETGAVKLYSDVNCENEVALNTATDKLTVYAKGISAGSATVTCTSNADSEKKASCDVMVNAAQTEELLTTITATGKEQANYSTANVATVSFSYTAGGSSAYLANWGWWGYGWTATVAPVNGYTITKCVFYDDANRTATDSSSPFVVETTEEDKTPRINGTPIDGGNSWSKGLKKIEVYGHATPTATHSVTITAGDHMTKTADSGEASQTDLTGAMTDVVYTADNGYYYPTDYSAAEVSGIKVTRDSYTQITVSGTPTADATITLTAPTAKTTPAAPTTAAAVDCTTSDNNDGTLTGVTTEMEYKKSDATEWTAGTGSDITGLVPGTYYVRVKATDTTNASSNQTLTIKEFISYTVTFKVVNGSWDEGEGDAATADKTVTLTGHDGDTLKLTADQIPAVGSKPNDIYKAGSWDTMPSAETEITGATTYTYTYAQKDSISQTVTFKVANGKWDDDTTSDKTVTLTGYEGDTLKLAAADIPAVGTKPNDTYKAGSWDTEPSTDTAITADTTYTYTYAQKDSISQTVTFKVANGKWDDDTTSDKTVTLTGYEGDTLKLAATDIPAVGTKPNDTYKAGSWDVMPSTDTAITADTTYTYTYAQKDSISQTVTFKVVNGSWNDETTTDKTVTLTGYEGDTLKLAATDIPAVGTKPNDTYKAGSWDVMPSTDTAITEATTYTYTYIAKEASVVTKAPEAKTLTYNGSAQELVTAGEATGGEMQYSLGDANGATQPYTTSIPAKTKAGTYYVWYKVVGDANHNDVAEKSVAVKIAPADKTELNTAIKACEDYYNTIKDNADYAKEAKALADEIEAAKKLSVNDNSKPSDVSEGTTKLNNSKKAAEEAVNGIIAAKKKETDDTAAANAVNEAIGKLPANDKIATTDKAAIEAVRKAYDALTADQKKKVSADTLKKLTDAEAALKTAEAADKAAKELAAAKEEAQTAMNEQVTVTQKGNKFTVKWKKSSSADGYYVYAQYCGKKVTKPVKTITKNTTTKTTISKIGGKKINQKKQFKVYVAPYKIIDGKKVTLGKSTVAHLVGSKNAKYSNVKKLTLTKSKYTVKVGKTAKIKAKVTLVNKNKKHIPKGHGAKFRYKSSDTSIATVDKNGKIKGIKKGTCTIYVYSINGLMKKAKVTIK